MFLGYLLYKIYKILFKRIIQDFNKYGMSTFRNYSNKKSFELFIITHKNVITCALIRYYYICEIENIILLKRIKCISSIMLVTLGKIAWY